MADVKRSEAEILEDAVKRAWTIMFMTLFDKEGYDGADLRRVMSEIIDLSDSVNKGYVTIPQMQQTLRDEAGIGIKRGGG